jgi:UDP-N-acetylglucosamine kinase
MYPGQSFAQIIGDDLRLFHPDHPRAVRHPDETVMPAVTAQASGRWVEMGIAYAAKHGYNAVVEGTFRGPETTLTTARAFAAAKHQVHVVALAVPEALSRLSCLERYYGERQAGRPGRWTPMDAHDAGYEGTPTPSRPPRMIQQFTV